MQHKLLKGLENKIREEYSECAYILGILYDTYILSRDDKIVFRNQDLGIVNKLKEYFSISQKVIPDNRGKNSHFISIQRKEANTYFEEFGINLPKKERIFPNFNEEYLKYFVKGFTEANIMIKTKSYTPIVYNYNDNFLSDLSLFLSKNANMKNKHPKDNHLNYGIKDMRKLVEYLYTSDELNELFNKEKKDRFCLLSKPSYNAKKEKIIEARKQIIDGANPKEITKELGYSNIMTFYMAFRREHKYGIRAFYRERNKKMDNN